MSWHQKHQPLSSGLPLVVQVFAAVLPRALLCKKCWSTILDKEELFISSNKSKLNKFNTCLNQLQYVYFADFKSMLCYNFIFSPCGKGQWITSCLGTRLVYKKIEVICFYCKHCCCKHSIIILVCHSLSILQALHDS